MIRFLLYFVCTLNLFSLISCNGCSSKTRGRKAKQETEEARTKEPSSMADKYAKIDKACNRLEVMIDTVSVNNVTEITLMRKEISTLKIEAKDIASDYEAAKLSGEIQKEIIDASIDYIGITILIDRTKTINSDFIKKFGSN